MLTIQQEAQLTGQSEEAIRASRTARMAARAWEQAQLTTLEVDGTVTDIPYGSAQWLALALDDPRRSAALLRAAAAWREHRAELAERVICQAHTDIALGELLRAEVTDEIRAECAAEQAADWNLIAGWARSLASVPTVAEQDKARGFAQSHEVQATVGWPPVRLPGTPARWRHLIDGRQVDLPSRERLEVAA